MNYHGIVNKDGIVTYYQHGYIHREEGPAIIHPDGTEEWYLYDRRHSNLGPAIKYPNGNVEYYVYGERVTNPEDYYYESKIVIQWNTDVYIPNSYHPVVIEFMDSVHPQPNSMNVQFNKNIREEGTWGAVVEFVYPSKILAESALEEFWLLTDSGNWVDKSMFVFHGGRL
jgi:hypothetical protein